jgi:hypothetical protein
MLAEIPQDPEPYYVGHNESLKKIADRYEIRPCDLAKLNGITIQTPIDSEHTLLVPERTESRTSQ